MRSRAWPDVAGELGEPWPSRRGGGGRAAGLSAGFRRAARSEPPGVSSGSKWSKDRIERMK